MDPVKLVPIEDWKALDKDARAETGVIKAHVGTMKIEGDAADRILNMTGSTADRDRDDDRIMQDGWDLDNYHKNPVILYGHDYSSVPIARSLSTGVDDENRLRFRAQFTPRELNPFGFMIYELAAEGYIKTTSVGFFPKKYGRDPEIDDMADDEKGWFGPVLFEEQELLELSIVPVPSNAAALIDARSVHGIDLSPMVPFVEWLLDTAGVKDIARLNIEKALGVAKPRPFHSLPAFIAQEGESILSSKGMKSLGDIGAINVRGDGIVVVNSMDPEAVRDALRKMRDNVRLKCGEEDPASTEPEPESTDSNSNDVPSVAELLAPLAEMAAPLSAEDLESLRRTAEAIATILSTQEEIEKVIAAAKDDEDDDEIVLDIVDDDDPAPPADPIDDGDEALEFDDDDFAALA